MLGLDDSFRPDVQVADAKSRDEVLGPLLGLITEAATLRDMAAELYVRLTEAGEGWE